MVQKHLIISNLTTKYYNLSVKIQNVVLLLNLKQVTQIHFYIVLKRFQKAVVLHFQFQHLRINGTDYLGKTENTIGAYVILK
jgi:hypothetical protein